MQPQHRASLGGLNEVYHKSEYPVYRIIQAITGNRNAISLGARAMLSIIDRQGMLPALAQCVHGNCDELAEERMRPVWAGSELWVELHTEHERMFIGVKFHDFYQFAVGR